MAETLHKDYTSASVSVNDISEERCCKMNKNDGFLEWLKYIKFRVSSKDSSWTMHWLYGGFNANPLCLKKKNNKFWTEERIANFDALNESRQFAIFLKNEN